MCKYIAKNKIPTPPDRARRVELQNTLCSEFHWKRPLDALRNQIAAIRFGRIIDGMEHLLNAATQAEAILETNSEDLPIFNKLFGNIAARHLSGPLYGHGPKVEYFAAMQDICLQLFLGAEFVCPRCFSPNNKKRCLTEAGIGNFVAI
jgi:hypothetical protein